MNENPFEDFARMRERLFNDALRWVCLAASVSVVLSVARFMSIGWRPVFLVQVALLAALWSVWLQRDRIAYGARVAALLAISWISTLAGMLQFGPVAQSSLHAVFFAFIAFLFLSGRTAAWLIGGNTLCLVLIGVAASQHWVDFSLDYSTYAHQPLVWLNTIWGLTAFSVIFARITSRMVQELLKRESMARRLAERQQKIAANVPGVIYQFLLRTDGSCCFPYASEGLQRLFGLSAEALRVNADAVFELVHPEDRARHRESIAASARSLAPIHETFRVVLPRGICWVERHSTPERLPNGNTLWHGFMRDMSADKLAELRLSSTLENTPSIAVQWYERDGRVLYWNHASELMFGWSREEAKGRPLDQLILSGRDAGTFQAALDKIALTGDVVGPSEFTIRHRDGKPRIVSATIFAIPGETCPVFVCMAVDITERKRVEDALRASEALFRLLLDSSPLPIMVKGADQKIMVLNQRFTDAFGYTLADIPDAENWWTLAYPDAAYRESLRLEWYRRLATVVKDGAAISMEAVVCCKDGTTRPIEAFASAAELFSVIVLSDQTQKKQVEDELLRAKEAAEAASRAKSDFLASMSHELRTPLNAIIGFAQMLDMGVPVPVNPSHKEGVGHILGSGRHLLGLINEVLDLTRIEAGKLDLVIHPMALEPLVDEAINLTSPAAGHRQIAVRHICQDCPSILGDAARVRQILLNLLSNAVKYNRDGGMVLVSCQTKGAMARVTVVDTGQGIPEAQRPRLFQPFQRLGAERTATEGTGIGLVICRKLAEAMGGSIGLESTEGVGSRFWVEFPIAPVGPGCEPTWHSLAPSKSPDATTGRVLYVEDNAANIAVMKHVFLQLPGVELQIAETAESGLALIRENLPDLVLMDINLPGMDGLTALAKIRADPWSADLPAFAVSAAALPQDVRNGLAAGFSGYFTKPFEVLELLGEIRKVLNLRHP